MLPFAAGAPADPIFEPLDTGTLTEPIFSSGGGAAVDLYRQRRQRARTAAVAQMLSVTGSSLRKTQLRAPIERRLRLGAGHAQAHLR